MNETKKKEKTHPSPNKASKCIVWAIDHGGDGLWVVGFFVVWVM